MLAVLLIGLGLVQTKRGHGGRVFDTVVPR
jgi:hypothetical protein